MNHLAFPLICEQRFWADTQCSKFKEGLVGGGETLKAHFSSMVGVYFFSVADCNRIFLICTPWNHYTVISGKTTIMKTGPAGFFVFFNLSCTDLDPAVRIPWTFNSLGLEILIQHSKCYSPPGHTVILAILAVFQIYKCICIFYSQPAGYEDHHPNKGCCCLSLPQCFLSASILIELSIVSKVQS